jgi:phosphatidylglycerophosphatase A
VARVDAGEELVDVWSNTGWDVTGAILTDVFGFGVLALADHPGLASLGKLALIGLTINFLACVVILPAALAFLPLVGPHRPRWSLSAWIVTSFGAGTSPKAPGTVGALLAIPIAWALSSQPAPIKVAALALLTIVGVAAAIRYLREGPSSGLPPSARPDDPQEIVIDETIGAAIAMAFVPFEPLWVALAFGLFRLLDITKPPPISWAERKLKGGFGVIFDDVVAGLIAGMILFGVRAFIGSG